MSSIQHVAAFSTVETRSTSDSIAALKASLLKLRHARSRRKPKLAQSTEAGLSSSSNEAGTGPGPRMAGSID